MNVYAHNTTQKMEFMVCLIDIHTFASFYMRTELKTLTHWYGIIAFQRLANIIIWNDSSTT